jgi:hypothetical protein
MTMKGIVNLEKCFGGVKRGACECHFNGVRA